MVYCYNIMEDSEDLNDRLMQHLRTSNKHVKSLVDIVQLLHVITSEQKARNMLRSCIDNVLMNMGNVLNLRDILERLHSVARINGLRFKVLPYKASAGPETSCQMSGDFFDVEILLDNRENNRAPNILDVRVTYSKQAKTCPELIEIIRNSQFLEFSKHLKSLVEMFPVSMDRQTKTRMYMALQSLEADVTKMSQLYKDSHKEADNISIVMHGLVGLLAPHIIGHCFQMQYFLTPYDLLNLKTRSFDKTLDDLNLEKGLLAEICIKIHPTPCNLPISPLISNNHPVTGSEKPRFLDVNQHNSVSMPACFVIKLKPHVLITQHIAAEIEKETNMSVFSKECKLESYLSLIKKAKDTQEVVFDEVKQQYNLNLDCIKSKFVSEILFSRPDHLLSILMLLRKQAYLNTIFQSCIRPKKSTAKELPIRFFDVIMEKNSSRINVTFQHPLSPNSTAHAEIDVTGDGFLSCNLYNGRNDPSLCSDQYALTILQKSFSLPVTMRAVMLQTKRNPRKEPDKYRSSRQSILQHPATTPSSKNSSPATSSQSIKPQPCNIPVTNIPQTTSVTSPGMHPSSMSPVPMQKDLANDSSRKKSQHPMLTQLLKPSKPVNNVAHSKDHPMLLNLLKDKPDNTKSHHLQHSQQQPQQDPQILKQRLLQPKLSGDMNTQQSLPPPPHYQTNNPPQMHFAHQQQPQPSQTQMLPPPSYQPPMQIKQQYPISLPQQSQFSNPSPLHLDDITGSAGPHLPSYNPQTVAAAHHSTTPPLYSPLPSPSSQPSPMSFISSPRQPPMNTPQPLRMASPRNATTTPPMMSPSTKKVAVGRRSSRAKTRSSDQTGFGDGMFDVSFTNNSSAFEPVTETNVNPTYNFQEVFGAGLSPANSQQPSLQHHISSPVITPILPNQNQRQFSDNGRFNFSFESDINLDNDFQRRDSYQRRLSNQPFMTPSPVLSTTQDIQDTAFPMSSPASSIDSFHPSAFAATDTKSMLDNSQSSFSNNQPDFSNTEVATSDTRNFFHKVENQTEHIDIDPFNFDDNKTPQKISMPDSVSLELKKNLSVLSRTSSISSNSGNEEGNSKTAHVPSNNSINTNSKVVKTAMVNAGGQRRGSKEHASPIQRSVDASQAGPVHKTLVRQNAFGKNTGMMRFQPLQGDTKEKTKKPRSIKDDKGPPKRRGRPPSTDKKEHPVKRKKTDNSEEELQRRKIVLNVQLNKGTPISSSTKMKLESPETSEKSSANVSNTPSVSNTSVETHLGQYSHGLRQYFRDQGELEKKKKEKKLATHPSLGITPISKNNNKVAGQSGTSLSGNSVVRAQLLSGKSAGNISSKSTAIHPKNVQVAVQPKPVPRGRNNSLNEVLAKLNDQRSQQSQASGSSTVKRGPATPKTTDANASVIKQKTVPPYNKFNLPQHSKMQVNKMTVEERLVTISKPITPKLVPNNRSPGSHSMKVLSKNSRPVVQVKREKQRPSTPIREGKGQGSFATALINPPLPNVQLHKSDPNSTKSKDSVADLINSQLKTGLVQSLEGIKRTPQNRPPLNKSPRSVTPPQARPAGAVTQKSERSMPSLHGRKSPSRATDTSLVTPPITDSINDKLNRNASTLGKRSSNQVASFLPPPTKKANLPTDATARESPRSPEDRLVIDDGTNDAVVAGAKQTIGRRTPTPTLPQLTPAANTTVNLFSSTPLANQISASPNIGVPLELDDALMDVAVTSNQDEN